MAEWKYESEDIERFEVTLTRPESETEDGLGLVLMQWVILDLNGLLAFADLTESYKKLLDFSKDGGIPIRKVCPGTPAEKNGLRKWDVIRRINGIDVRYAGAQEIYSLLSGLSRAVLRVYRDNKIEDRMPQLTLSGAEDHMAEQAPDNPEDLNDVVAYMGYSTMHKLRSMIGYNRLEESSIPMAPKDAGLGAMPKEVNVSIVCGNHGSGITLKDFNLKELSTIDMEIDRRVMLQELFCFADIGCVVEGVMTPAEEAGVREMDILLFINSESVREMSPAEVTESYLKRNQGSKLDLILLREETVRERQGRLIGTTGAAAGGGGGGGASGYMNTVRGMFDNLKVADTSSTMAILRSQGLPSFKNLKEGLRDKVTQLSEAQVPSAIRMPIVPIPLPSLSSWMSPWSSKPTIPTTSQQEDSAKVLLEGKHRADTAFVNIQRGPRGYGFMPVPWNTHSLHHAPSFQFSAWNNWKKLFHFAPDGGLPVRGVFAGSEAEKAGLRKWDVIQYVEGEDVREESLESIRSLIRGVAGEVRLKILRDPNV